MALLIGGSKPGEFNEPDGETNYSNDDSFYSSGAIGVILGKSFDYTLESAVDELWVKFHIDFSGSIVADAVMLRFASATGDIFRIRGINTYQVQPELWNGSTWLAVGDILDTRTTSGFIQGAQFWMFRIKIGVSGAIQWFSGSNAGPDCNTQILEYLGDTSALGNINYVYFGGTHPGAYQDYSEVMIATHNLRYSRLPALGPSSAGALSEWTGGEAEIDENNINDADYATSATAGQRLLVQISDLGNSDNYDVRAVVAYHRLRANETGPQNANALLRHSDGTINTQALPAPLQTFSSYPIVYASNPVTGEPFTRTDVNALQLGIESEN